MSVHARRYTTAPAKQNYGPRKRLPRRVTAIVTVTALLFSGLVAGSGAVTAAPIAGTQSAAKIEPPRPYKSVKSQTTSAPSRTGTGAAEATPATKVTSTTTAAQSAAPRAPVVDLLSTLDLPAVRSILTAAEQEAVNAAKQAGHAVEVVAERTTDTTVLAQPNGSITLQMNAGPIRVKVGDSWKDLDSTLSKNGLGQVVPVQTMFPMTFSGGGVGPLASLSAPRGTVAVSWPRLLPQPAVKGSSATYANAAPDTDIVVDARRSSLDIKLVIKTRPATAPTFTLPVTIPLGATVDRLESGVPVVRTADGQDVALIGTAQMSDASIDEATGLSGTLKRVDSSLTAGLPGTATLTLRPDAAFLADPATKYPVTIDPTVVPNLTDNLDTMVVNGSLANNNYDGDQYLYVGYNSNYGTLARSYLRFNNSSIKPNGGPNKVVTDAKLKLVQNTSAGCGARRANIRAAAGLTTGKTWNTKPAIYINPFDSYFNNNVGTVNGCGTGSFITDVTDLVQAWADDGNSSPETIAIVADNESDGSYFKAFYSADTSNANNDPVITASIATQPTAGPTGVSATAGDGNVTVSWTQVPSSANGGSPITGYKISTTDGTKSTTVGAGNAGTLSGLTNGTEYQVKVQAVNAVGPGTYSAASNTFVPKPPAPTVTTSAGTGVLTAPGQTLNYTSTISNGGTAQTVTVKDPAAIGTAGSVQIKFGTGSPQTCSAAGVTCVINAPGTTNAGLTVSGLNLPANVATVVTYTGVAQQVSRATCSPVSATASAIALAGTVNATVAGTAAAICDSGLGLEPWFSYVSRPVGPVGVANVNAANGNLVVQQLDSTSIQARGRLFLHPSPHLQQPGHHRAVAAGFPRRVGGS